jgi:hypothetical protein
MPAACHRNGVVGGRWINRHTRCTFPAGLRTAMRGSPYCRACPRSVRWSPRAQSNRRAPARRITPQRRSCSGRRRIRPSHAGLADGHAKDYEQPGQQRKIDQSRPAAHAEQVVLTASRFSGHRFGGTGSLAGGSAGTTLIPPPPYRPQRTAGRRTRPEVAGRGARGDPAGAGHHRPPPAPAWIHLSCACSGDHPGLDACRTRSNHSKGVEDDGPLGRVLPRRRAESLSTRYTREAMPIRSSATLFRTVLVAGS